MNIKTTSFPLRLPPALKASAQERASAVGLSLNGFVCVALDAYLSAAVPPPALPPPPAKAPPPVFPPAPAAAPAAAPAMNREQRRAAKSKRRR